MHQRPTVFVVDDDSEMLQAITPILVSAALRVLTFPSAESFLEYHPAAGEGPRCLVLDVRMPLMSGLGLQAKLSQESRGIPIIFLTGFASVSMAVQALQGGAVDFLEKPLHRQSLLERVERALDIDAQAGQAVARQDQHQSKLAQLTLRERDVLALLIEGRNSKEIAAQLNIGIPTVTRHRTRVLSKMRVRNVVELVHATYAASN